MGDCASNIEPLVFREIMILPFAIGACGRSRGQGLLGSSLMQRACAIVEKRPDVWTRVTDRRLHLSDDVAADGEKPEDRVRRLRDAYEEFVYFEPYVQRFLYGRAAGEDRDEAFRLYRRDDVMGLKVAFQDQPKREHTFAVERCNLYVFETGNAFLVLEVRHEEVEDDEKPSKLTLADCQNIIEKLRRVFPPFFSEKDGKFGNRSAPLSAFYYASSLKLLDRAGDDIVVDTTGGTIASSISPADAIETVFGDSGKGEAVSAPMFAPWKALLSPLTIAGVSRPGRDHEAQLHQLGDDRAFIMAQIGVPDSRFIRDQDWARLHQADGAKEAWPYPKEFVEEWSRGRVYDRFFSFKGERDHTTRYLVCNFAFVAVGSVGCDKETGKIKVDDFFYHLGSRHFRRHYFQLVLIAFLHKTALKTLSDRLAEAVMDEKSFLKTSSGLHDEVLHFTHRYWFEDISSQIQGQELFDLLRRELRTRELYDQLNKEIAQTTARRELKRQGELAEAAQRLNIIAGFGLAAGCAAGVFGMNIYDPTAPSLVRLDGVTFVAILFGVIIFFALLYKFSDRVIAFMRRPVPFVSATIAGATFVFTVLVSKLSGD